MFALSKRYTGGDRFCGIENPSLFRRSGEMRILVEYELDIEWMGFTGFRRENGRAGVEARIGVRRDLLRSKGRGKSYLYR